MARRESDREDLLREATALVERAELRIGSCAEPVVIGFRRGGGASLFFGGEEVYQFNADGELRRAFVGGRLIKAERGRLIALVRERTPEVVALVRTELKPAEERDLLRAARAQMDVLSAALRAGKYEVLRVVPSDADVVGRIRAWLAASSGVIVVAQRPNV